MKQKIFMIVVPILCVLAAALAYLKFVNTETDAIKFKKEYEEHNEVEAYGFKYQNLNISSNNPMKYSNYDEILDVIKNGTGIIYLGFPQCPWCRTALPVLLDVAEENKIETIYYLNILNDRDSYVVQDGELTYELDEDGNEKKGTEGYFKLLKALDKHLSDYVITFEDEEYETGEKRIYAPTMVFVKDGEVLGIHVSTVVSQESGFDKLTDEEYEELYSIYEDYILELSNASCSLDSAC